MVRLTFEFDTPFGVFRDALYLPESHGLTDEQIAAMKHERLENWLAIVSAPQGAENG